MFLDRDGTLIYDVGYPRDPRQVQLLPGAGQALKKLKEQGFLLVLVSNQSGIGRGLVTAEQAEQVHQEFLSQLERYGVQLDAVYYCPHAPGEQNRCRKPSPAMLLQAAKELDLDLTRSFMVGDKASDVEAGKRAGCQTVLLSTKPVLDELDPMPDEVAGSWPEVVQCILGRSGARG